MSLTAATTRNGMPRSQTAASMTTKQLAIYPPSTSLASSSSHPLDHRSRPDTKLLGTWYIVGTSLALWSQSKNVAIRYTANPTGTSNEVRFDDEIRSEHKSKSPEPWYGKRVRRHIEREWKLAEGIKTTYFGIRGTNQLQRNAQNGASYRWTGHYLLKLFHSDWQVIGYGSYDLEEEPWDWVVTYFQGTMATAAGIDVYVRDPEKMPKETYDAIVDKMNRLEAEYAESATAQQMSRLARQLFEVPHDP